MDVHTVDDWFAAVASGNQPLVAGYSPRFKKSVNKQGMTALMVAAQMGNVELSTILLKDEQRIKDRMGRTALIYAIQSGQPQLCQLLATRELDTSNFKSQSPFSIAIQDDAHECLEAMLHVVGPVSVVDNPLLTAVSVGCLRCLRILLEHGQCFEIEQFDEALARAEDLGFAELCTELLSWKHKIPSIVENANKVSQELKRPANNSINASARELVESHFVDISEIKSDLNERIAHLLAENKELRAMLKKAESNNEVLRAELNDILAQQEDVDSQDEEGVITKDVCPQLMNSGPASAADDLSKANLQLPVDLLDEVLPLDVTETVSSSMIQVARNSTLKSNSYLLSRRLFGEQSACDQSHSASLLAEQQNTLEDGDRKSAGAGQMQHKGSTYHRSAGNKRKKTHHNK